MYFEVEAVERNGEYVYDRNYLIEADNEDEAYEKACSHFSDFYPAELVTKKMGEKDFTTYEFDWGGIAIGFYPPKKTTKKDFIKKMMFTKFIK